jgi:hypothetical protein
LIPCHFLQLSSPQENYRYDLDIETSRLDGGNSILLK